MPLDCDRRTRNFEPSSCATQEHHHGRWSAGRTPNSPKSSILFLCGTIALELLDSSRASRQGFSHLVFTMSFGSSRLYGPDTGTPSVEQYYVAPSERLGWSSSDSAIPDTRPDEADNSNHAASLVEDTGIAYPDIGAANSLSDPSRSCDSPPDHLRQSSTSNDVAGSRIRETSSSEVTSLYVRAWIDAWVRG